MPYESVTSLGAPGAQGVLGGLWRAVLPPMNSRYRRKPCARNGLVALSVRYFIPTVLLGPVGFPVKSMGDPARGGEEWRRGGVPTGQFRAGLQYQGPTVC